jgi:tRNA A-37 threonylcarbamoyl transferase component Bud32
MHNFFEERTSKSGKTYYLNTLSRETRWGLPTYKNGKTLLPVGWERVMSYKKLPREFYYYNKLLRVVIWEIPTISSIYAPISIIEEDCNKKSIWKMEKMIGKGSCGEVYESSEYVVKIQNVDQQFFQEVMALQELQSTNIVPKLFDVWTCEKLGYIVMEKLSSTNSYLPKMSATKIWEEVGQMLNTIKSFGWLHIDTTTSNVMVTNEGKLVLIDFGLSVKKTDLGEDQTYPEHLHSKNYKRDLTWGQLKAFQNYKYHFSFNPCADFYSESYSECSIEQEKQYQEANKKWKAILA